MPRQDFIPSHGIPREIQCDLPPPFAPSHAENAPKIGTCPLSIVLSASSSENHPARSTSGNAAIRPDRGGHPMLNRLLLIDAASHSPSSAHALTIFPPGCLNRPSATKSPSTACPVS